MSSFLLIGAEPAQATGTLRFEVQRPGGLSAAAAQQQEVVAAFCPGVPFPAVFGIGSAIGSLIEAQVTVTGVELSPPCTVTQGTGTCSVDSPTTLSFSVTIGAEGAATVEAQGLIPADSPHSGELCGSITWTETPAGGAPGDPNEFALCVGYQCQPVPALGWPELGLLALLLGITAVFALARRLA